MTEYDYPDVLGAITGGLRFETKTLQYAVGVYPGQAALGQPFEVLVILQSTIDRPQEIVVGLQLPRRDAAGNALSFFLPKRQIRLSQEAGEVGVIHFPIIPQPPTPPAAGYPLIVKIFSRTQDKTERVRVPGAGRPPSTLSISPFKLDVLREIDFSAEGHANQMRCRFNVIPGQVKRGLVNPVLKYEKLWTQDEFEAERGQLDHSRAEAERLALDFTRTRLYYDVEARTAEAFEQAGLPLHPAEALLASKAITYVYDDAYQYETDFDLRDARWFNWLSSLLMQDPLAGKRSVADLAIHELFMGAVFDAVVVTMPMVEVAAGQSFGDRSQHRQYAEKVVQALQGAAPMENRYAYLPLVHAGLLLNMRMTIRGEDLWGNLDALEEALRERMRLSGGQSDDIFRISERLLADARDLLRRSRVPRESSE